MRATDERRSINAECPCSSAVPDGSQGKRRSPHQQTAPEARPVWDESGKTLRTQARSTLRKGFEGSPWLLEGTRVWVTPVFCAATVSLRQREAACPSHRVEGHGCRGQKGPLVSALSSCRQIVSLHIAKLTPTAGTSRGKIFCPLPLCASNPLKARISQGQAKLGCGTTGSGPYGESGGYASRCGGWGLGAPSRTCSRGARRA